MLDLFAILLSFFSVLRANLELSCVLFVPGID